jgi:uncharacterized alkaline shock family protein YloU
VADPALSIAGPRGRISISPEAVAQVVAHTVAECYGVVEMSAPGRTPARRLLARVQPARGIAVTGGPDGVAIDVHVVVEHGLNLAEVASTVRSRVAYEVERLTGLTVASVDVHIRDVRRTA